MPHAADDPLRLTLLRLYQSALEAVDGRRCVTRALASIVLREPIYVIAIGKAACAMAQGADDVLGHRIRDALIVTKHNYSEVLRWPVHEAGHPRPDAASLDAGEALSAFISRMPMEAAVLVLLSGGASALIEQLPSGLSLAYLQVLNDRLLASGRDIAEMNAIRRRLSLIKGGRLAKRLEPREVVCLAISDVPGDDPATIGSGPLSADADAGRPLDVDDVPAAIRPFLRQPPPAPPTDDPCFAHVRYEVIARLADALAAAAKAAANLNLDVHVHDALVEGDARTAGETLARMLVESPSGSLHLWGGETTVRLPVHAGRGGRAQHLALAAARLLNGHRDTALLVAASDGTDGPTEDAGAIVDGGTVARGEAEGQSVDRALVAADSGRFLESAGDLIQTGPTGTNVMDLMMGIRLGE